MLFFFKQKTAYEMRISDWSSDVCSSDLPPRVELGQFVLEEDPRIAGEVDEVGGAFLPRIGGEEMLLAVVCRVGIAPHQHPGGAGRAVRSEERPVGQAGDSTGRSRWSTHHNKKKREQQTRKGEERR